MFSTKSGFCILHRGGADSGYIFRPQSYVKWSNNSSLVVEYVVSGRTTNLDLCFWNIHSDCASAVINTVRRKEVQYIAQGVI